MLELRVDFRSYDEWAAWQEQHRPAFDEWRQEVLADVARYGLVEPVGEIRQPPWAVTINHANLRESISAAEMNSRKRGCLFALDLACHSLPAGRRQRPKILGAEAISRVARVLRGAFPHFLGAEYLPSEAERERHYPVPHLDLLDAGFPDAAFDLFYSSDVLEHVPDLDHALREIARMLRPGGIMVSSFPFNPGARATQRRAARDRDGRLVHHQPPEYHDNPIRPSEGSLVFVTPGWDVLESARRAGFADAKMTLVVSSTFGVAAAPVPGILVMSALKAPQSADAARLAPVDFAYRGPRLRRLLGLVGLARSGTTLLCSILGVHSGIEAIYEPFNVSKDRPLPPLGIDRFFSEFPTDMHGKETLLVKETATRIAFLDRTATLLHSCAPPLRRDLIVLLRNPLHAYLSMLEAQKKWWGGNHQLSPESFQGWAHHNLAGLKRLLELGREFNAVVVSYEALAADKARIVPLLMHQLGHECEDRQLNFEQFVDKRRVRGDITIATEPFAISDERVRQRASELSTAEEQIKPAAHYPRIREIAELTARFEDVGVARFDSGAAQRALQPMQDLLQA